MGGKLSSALSPETRNLLRDNKDFFESISKQGEANGKKIQGKDSEARTEVEVQADGNVAVSFVFPVDDNADATDGRIYVRDTFVFDPSQKKLNGYKRDFEYNGRGENKEEWKKWLAAYRSAPLPDDPKIQAFGAMVARSYSRPFSPQQIEIFSKNKATQFQTLIDATSEAGVALRVRDPRSHYAVFYRGLTTEVVFSYVAEDAEGKKDGHLLVQDKFSFNGNTGELVGYDRGVKVGAEGSDAAFWQAKAAKLAAAEKPSAETAKAFIKNFQPDLFTAVYIPAAKAEAEPAQYAEYSDALFKKTMNSLVRSSKAIPMAALEPQFFQGLTKAAKYFEPLQASLGSDFTLNLKDPPLEVSTQVEGDKTSVFLKFTFKPAGEAGTVDYTERWTFEKGFPAKVERRAQNLGGAEGGVADRVAKRINEDIQAGKYPPLQDDQKKFDPRTVAVLEGTIPYVAPHLTYFGMPKVLEKPDLGYDQRIVFETLDSAQAALTPLLNQSGVDPILRARVTRMLTGMVYGDLNTASAAMSELQESEQKALQAAATPEEKQRHEDFLRLTETVLALSSGDLDKAQELTKAFHSPALKRAFEKPLAPAFARRRSLEGLAVLSKVAEDQIALRVHDSKAWSYKGPKIDPEAEKKTLQGLFEKAFLQTTQSKSSDALTVLRELTEVGKGKKVEEYNPVEKKLALTPDERALAERLMGDSLMKKLSDAAREDIKDIQAQTYLTIARDDLFSKGMAGSARWLTQMVAMDKLPKSRSAESLDLLKTMAGEKIDNAYASLKQDPTKLEMPPEMKALEPLLTKVAEKSIQDPKQTILQILRGMTDLQGDEAKLRDRLLKSPSLQKVEEAAKLPTVAQRVAEYRKLFDPILKQDPNNPNPKLAEVKKVIDEQLGMVEKMSQDDAPGPEGVLLSQLLIQLDLASEEEKKMTSLRADAEAHDKEMKAAQSLLDKASVAAVSRPDATAFDILRGLADADLSEDEKKIRTKLLEDKTLEKYVGIAGEAAMEKRGEKYLAAIKDQELGKAGYPQTQAWLASMLQSGKIPDQRGYFPALPAGAPKPPAQEQAEKLQSDVRKFLALTEGKGDFGTKFEFGAKHFAKEVSKPTMIAAMTIAPFVGSGCELAGLWKFRTWGSAGRVIAAGIGVTGEAAAFTYSSKALDSYFYSSEGVWDNHVKDFKSNVLLFGAMRTAHYGSAAFTERFLATGRMGKWAGGYVAGEAGASGLAETPLGKLESVGKATGPGAAPQLTVAGKRLGGLLDHGAAVGAMYGAGKANKKLGWSQHDGTLPETLLMYMQAMVGFKLANSATGGRLGLGMASARMRIDNVAKGGAPEPVPGKPVTPDMPWLFDRMPKDVTLRAGEAEGGEVQGISLPKPEVKTSLDAILLAGKGKGLSLSRGKDGTLSLHNDQKVEEPAEPLPEEKKADPKSEEKKADSPKPKKRKKVAAKPAADAKPEEAKGEEAKAADPKPAAEKAEDGKAPDPAADGDSAAEPKPAADAKPAPSPKQPATVLVNGKPVGLGESVTLSEGDVISVDGKEVRVELPHPLAKELATVPRDQQLSLARHIAKAKDPAALFNMLKDSPYQGAVDILHAVSEVFSGKKPLSGLPTELGIQAKVKALLESQVADLKKAGLELSSGTQVKDGLIDPRLSPLEVEFQTLKALEALKLRVGMAKSLPELLEVLGEASFQEVGGVKLSDIFEWLGQEQLKAVAEQAAKNEASLREKIEIGERRLKQEEAKPEKKPGLVKTVKGALTGTKDPAVIEELNEKLKNWREALEQSKNLQAMLEKALEAMQPKVEADSAEKKAEGTEAEPGKDAVAPQDLAKRQAAEAEALAKALEKLPVDLGIRQKARDSVEQSKGDFAKGLEEKERKTVIEVVKKYLDIQMKDDFDAAQRSLRRELDAASPQARLMLRRAKPEELDLLLKVYFGKGEARELPAAQAFQVANLFAQSKVKEGLGILQVLADGGNTLQLVRGDLDALAKQVEGKALILRTHTANSDGKSLVFTKGEILGLVEQAKRVHAAQEAAGEVEAEYRGSPDKPFSGQNSDTQVFYDPETNSFQTWVVHPQGLSKVRITLDEKGELEGFEIKYAARPEASGSMAGLLTPPKFQELKDADGQVVPVQEAKVDYQALIKEFPFDVPGVTRTERVFDGMAKVADKVPSLPKLPKFGKGKAADGKGPKDPPAGGAAKADAKPGEGAKAKKKAKAKSEAAAKPVETKPLDAADGKAAAPAETKPEAKAEGKPSADAATPAKGLMAFLGAKFSPVAALFRSVTGFFSGGKTKAAAKVDSAKQSVPAKPADPAVVKPASMPPPVEGNRPTLPEGLIFPPAKVAMGERGGFEGPEALEFHQKSNPVMGEFSGLTHEGEGRKSENQDLVAYAYTPEGDLMILAVDGMGGHDNGKRAAQILGETMVLEVSGGKSIQDASQLANQKVMAELYDPSNRKSGGAGVVVIKVNRPAVAGAPETLETFWGSDPQFVLFRKAPDGHANWIYSTFPDNFAWTIVTNGPKGEQYGPKGEGRDLAINSHPMASNIANPVGQPGFQLRFTAAGEVYDPETGFRSAKGLDKIALEKGDVGIGGSDGLWKNIPDRNLAYEWTKDAKTAQEKAQILNDKVRARMKIVAEADEKFESGQLPSDQRMPFALEGKSLFIDNAGNVYDQATGGKMVDHYEADNFSVFVYIHNPGAKPEVARIESSPPKAEEAGPRPPSDTELSDPDKTTMWLRPEALKETKVAPAPAPDPDNEVTVVQPMPKDPKENP
ncbi:MAG: hypothetical protein U1F66_06610 [bacterium]